MIALLAALNQEVSALRRQMALAPAHIAGLNVPGFTGIYRERTVLLAITGMGRARAEAAAVAVFEHAPVTAVLSIGFSGALSTALEVGDLILASSLLALSDFGSDDTALPPYPPDSTLLHAATASLRAASQRVIIGQTFTAPAVISTPGEKQALHDRTGAIAVDMESYWIARLAATHGLPFLVLRVISDALHDPLPPFEQFLDVDGALHIHQLATCLLRNPRNLSLLIRTARHSGHARRALTMGVLSLFTPR
ncbi:MAG: hypothetical protein JW892_09360 [Anaerolineae bacterium]|nr:hypothetical protein [Anaerolineae bacterium]